MSQLTRALQDPADLRPHLPPQPARVTKIASSNQQTDGSSAPCGSAKTACLAAPRLVHCFKAQSRVPLIPALRRIEESTVHAYRDGRR